MRTRRHAHGILAIAVVLAGGGGMAWGQMAPVTDGRALDANPLVGSGGANNPVAGFVPVNGNDVITGNVTGLGYFHGRIPYKSPYEFRGNLPSSALGGFARQSSGGIPEAPGSPQTFFLPSTVVSTQGGQINPGAAAGVGSGGVGSGFESRLVGGAAVNPGSAAAGRIELRGNRLELVPAQGTEPVTGQGTLPEQPGEAGNGLESNPFYGMRSPVQPMGLRPELGGGMLGKPGAESKGQPGRTPAEGVEGRGEPGNKAGGPADRGAGERVQGRVGEAVEGGSRARDAVDGAVAGRPGEDPTLRALRQAAAAERGTAEATAQAERDLKAAQESLAGRGSGVAPGVDRAAGTDPLGVPGAGRPAAGGVGEAAGRVAGTQPALVLPSKRVSVEEVMARAGGEMGKQQYLDAVDTYNNVLQIDQGHTAALVGRLHAEIGAGLYDTAAHDLQFLLERKPELVAAKGAVQALEAKRVASIKKELGASMEAQWGKRDAETAPLLLSYLQYQTGDEAGLKATVDGWAKRMPASRWPGVVRKVWGGTK